MYVRSVSPPRVYDRRCPTTEEPPPVSTHPEPAPTARAGRPSLDALFADAQPIGSADDLARAGVFDDSEIDEFLTDLYAMRRSNLA